MIQSAIPEAVRVRFYGAAQRDFRGWKCSSGELLASSEERLVFAMGNERRRKREREREINTR